MRMKRRAREGRGKHIFLSQHATKPRPSVLKDRVGASVRDNRMQCVGPRGAWDEGQRRPVVYRCGFPTQTIVAAVTGEKEPPLDDERDRAQVR